MQIYPAEKSIAHLISKASIAYCTQLVEAQEPNENFVEEVRKALANENIQQDDLYPLTTILVTTGMNKNTDYFDPKETWAAKDSPKHKPFNLGHNEKEIIGHMIGNYVIDANNKVVSNEITEDQLPAKFHIVTPSVLYKHWEDPVLKARTANLINKIEAGELFVSMEALFKNFDYVLKDKAGAYTVVPRNEQTAFLTKHLRCYGGRGVYKDYTIGRVLRGITFSGKGLVENPANPESIIFPVERKNSFADTIQISTASNEFTKTIIDMEKNMAENNEFFEKQVAFLQNQNTTLAAEKSELAVANAGLKAEVTAKTTASEAKIAELQTKLTKAESDLKTANETISAKEKEVEAAKKDKEESDKKWSDMKSKCETLSTEIDTIKAAAQLADRTSYVVANLKKNEADAKKFAETYASLSGDQFKVIVDTIKASIPAPVSAAEKAQDVLDNLLPNNDIPLNVQASDAQKELDDLGNALAENLGKAIASMGSNRRGSNDN